MIQPACLHCRATESERAAFDYAAMVEGLLRERSRRVYICGKAELGLRRWASAGARKSEATISGLLAVGHFKNARRARRDHPAKTAVQLDALFKAARRRWPTRMKMSDGEREAVRLKRVQAVFDKLPQAGRLTKPARGRQRLIAKRNGRGKRPVINFHWVDQARQIMLRSAHTPFANLHEAQFMLRQNGRPHGPAAVREALRRALAECGSDYLFMHFDVEDFHGSISHGWLERHLGIDPMVIRRHVHMGAMQIEAPRTTATVHATHEACREGGQWGIPQGSALSCLIAEQVMADVLRSAAVFEEVPVFVWSDNIGVLAPRHRAGEIADLVSKAFEAHGAGPFNLRDPIIRQVTQEFEFLGVNYRLANGTFPCAYVARRKVNAWELSIGSRAMTASVAELDLIAEHIDRKRAQWAWWAGWPKVELRMLTLLANARASIRNYGVVAATAQ